MAALAGMIVGAVAWFLLFYLVAGLYTVAPNERAVKTSFGRAIRLGNRSTLDDPISASLTDEEKERYRFPQLKVIPPGGPYFAWPWEKVYKVDVAVQTANMAYDPEQPEANRRGTVLEAVTKDQLNTGLTGQIRYGVSERNIYAYLFGVQQPFVHVMGYFVSVLRERISNYEAPKKPVVAGDPIEEKANIIINVSINDLRKNVSDLNDHMFRECQCSAARYGMVLDASLITGIDPPNEVESALAAINTAHNEVSSQISLAQAGADQQIVQSKRAVEIQTLNAQAEVQPMLALASQLQELEKAGPDVLDAYVRSVRLGVVAKAKQAVLEVGE